MITEHPEPGRVYEELAGFIDQTQLKPLAPEDIIEDCVKAAGAGCACFVTHSFYLPALAGISRGRTLLSAVIDFPFGLSGTEAKIREITEAVQNGAEELDIVINLAYAASQNYHSIRKELSSIDRISKGLTRKIIIETAFRNELSTRVLGEMIAEIGFEFVKTSTGFADKGAKVRDIMVLAKVTGGKCGVKASGGIRNLDGCLKMIAAGAGRIGTSRGLDILAEARSLPVDHPVYLNIINLLKKKENTSHGK